MQLPRLIAQQKWLCGGENDGVSWFVGPSVDDAQSSLRLLETKDDPATVVSNAIPPRSARGTPVRASVVVCGAREAAVALVVAEASLVVDVVVGALVVAE